MINEENYKNKKNKNHQLVWINNILLENSN